MVKLTKTAFIISSMIGKSFHNISELLLDHMITGGVGLNVSLKYCMQGIV